jgi:excisionase family DNA binding protein
MQPLVSVSDAADVLGLSQRRVRALIEAGQLPAERAGRSWLISQRALDRLRRRARRHGRRLSPQNGWALLAVLAGEKPEWVRPDVLSRLRRYARDPDWLLSVLEHSEPRAEIHFLWLPKEDLRNLDDYPLVRSGLSAKSAVAHLDVMRRREEPLDAYASADVARGIARRFAPEENVDDPNLILRIPSINWVSGAEEEVPLPVVAADLLDHDDPRVRGAAERRLQELALDG